MNNKRAWLFLLIGVLAAAVVATGYWRWATGRDRFPRFSYLSDEMNQHSSDGSGAFHVAAHGRAKSFDEFLHGGHDDAFLYRVPRGGRIVIEPEWTKTTLGSDGVTVVAVLTLRYMPTAGGPNLALELKDQEFARQAWRSAGQQTRLKAYHHVCGRLAGRLAGMLKADPGVVQIAWSQHDVLLPQTDKDQVWGLGEQGIYHSGELRLLDWRPDRTVLARFPAEPQPATQPGSNSEKTSDL